MILTVDIGNSRIKWVSWQAGRIETRGVAAYAIDKIDDVFDKLFLVVEKPDCIYAVCVAGDEIAHALSQWCVQRWRLDVEFLKTEKQFNKIINAYADPLQHGADRWAAVVAAHQSYPESSACIISAGTALTFDLINKNGQHLGGYILPSYATMRTALMADTAKVESTYNKRFNECLVPDNTDDAVNAGLHKLLQAGIRELCQFAQNKLDDPVHIIITGGFASTILKYPDMPVMQHKPDLVMQGLFSIMSQHNNDLCNTSEAP